MIKSRKMLTDEMEKVFLSQGPRIAVEFEQTSLSFHELELTTLKFMQELLAHNIFPGHFIGLHFPRGIDEYIAILSLLRSGIVGLSFGGDYSVDQIKLKCLSLPFDYILVHSSIKDLYDQNDFLFSFDAFFFLKVHKNLDQRRLHESCAWTLMTTGSTGAPKTVMISADNLLLRAQGEIRDFALTTQDRVLNYLSFSHDLGLNQLLSSFFTGATLIIHHYVFLTDLINCIESQSITTITAIPLLWRQLLKKDRPFGMGLQSLRLLTISGGSLTEVEYGELKRALPDVHLLKTYGQTETFRSLLHSSKSEISSRSLGRPIYGVNLVIDVLSDELIHYGTGSMLGYFEDDIETNQKFTIDGGIRTGDYFKIEGGEFFYLGRKDEMLKVNGRKFYPREIEDKLMEHDKIEECAIVVIKDSNENEMTIVFFVATETISSNELRNYLQHRILAPLMPRHFIQLSDLPIIGIGKPDRAALKEKAQSFLATIYRV